MRSIMIAALALLFPLVGAYSSVQAGETKAAVEKMIRRNEGCD